MRFRNFRFQILLRLVLISAGLYGLVYYLFIEINYIRVFFLGLFVLTILLTLFIYLNKSNKDTKNFLEAILNNDFTIKYNSSNQGKSYDELYDTFNKVNDKFVESSQYEASQYQYITTLINQLQVSILAFDEKERIHLTNDAFHELLGQKELIHLKGLKTQYPELFEQIRQIKNGETLVFKADIQGRIHRLSMTASAFKLRQRQYKLVSFQDIHSELDQNEMEAWQKLIRVLTHEIMNSVAPITSLSSTLKNLVQKGPLDQPKQRTLEEGLDAIEVRSQGLMNFTQTYRSLTRIPLPVIRKTEGKVFFQRIASLFEPTLADTKIQWEMKLPETPFNLLIDAGLMEQVLINLLKNAKEAVSHKSGVISLSINQPEGSHHQVITITDNGSGISEEIAEKIFIPFYTTKTEGSGIGLSLARQIVQLHQATLNFTTSSEGTSFYIKL